MSLIHKAQHLLAHLLRCNYGQPETWWQGDKLMAGFRCSGCGKLQDIHDTGKRFGANVLKRGATQ